MIVIVCLCFLVWWVIGVAGFVFWWTSQFDFTVGETGFAAFVGLSGPFAWIIGYVIHGPDQASSIVVKRRG